MSTFNEWEAYGGLDPEQDSESGLCYFCGEIDDLRNLIRISGSWLSHHECAKQSPAIVEGREREARIDERNGK